MQRFILVLLVVVCGSVAAAAQAAPELLPPSFGEWKRAEAPSSPEFTAAQKGYLQEFGLKTSAQATYRARGHSATVTAFQFPDSTGAYGTYTLMRDATMRPEKVGTAGASGNAETIFFVGDMVADVKGEVSPKALDALARSLPVSHHPGRLPGLPKYLPPQELVLNSLKYVVGPNGLALSGAPIDAPQVNFGSSAEVVTGQYKTAEGQATVTVISYPTPQIAALQLRRISPSYVDPSKPSDLIKRSSSVLVLTSGALSPDEAKSLIASVNFSGEITWDEPTKMQGRNNPYGLIWNALVLSGILIGICFVFGIFFGGFRAIYFKLNPQKAEIHEHNQELIRLNL